MVNTLYCSFCGKHHSEVKKLIAGPSVFICDKCSILTVELCLQNPNSSKETFKELGQIYGKHLCTL